MGDNYEIWRETGQLASCCTSIYSFPSIWFTNSLNICNILFSEISDTLIISFSVLMKVLEIYDKKILQRLSIVAGIANDDGDSGEEDVSKEF